MAPELPRSQSNQCFMGCDGDTDGGKSTGPRGSAATGCFHVVQNLTNGPLLIFSRRNAENFRQLVLMLGLIGVDAAATFINVCKTTRRLSASLLKSLIDSGRDD